MASKTLGRTLGLVTMLALAPTFAGQKASAGETELMVIVTPYLTQPTRPNQGNTQGGNRFQANAAAQNQASSNGQAEEGPPKTSK